MIKRAELKNFKCFRDSGIDFHKVTVLAGSNSAGKSSMIQSLLLSRIAIEKLQTYSVLESRFSHSMSVSIPLNGRYQMSLGNTREVLTRNSDNNIITVQLTNHDDRHVFLSLVAEDVRDDVYNLELQSDFTVSPDFSELKDEFYYLNAERIGPRLTYDVEQLEFDHVGWQGEFTIQVLAQKRELSIEQTSNCRFGEGQDLRLLNQVREWMAYIIPGFYLDEAQLEGKLKKAYTSFSKSSPTNVGFGISYVLPIIVNGLLAKKNAVFIVENPEAHLHPKGQSNIGYFLAKLAASGVQVIIETHSEHVVNGIRRAALVLEAIKAEDVLINFFDSRNNEITKITLSEEGDLSAFPRDFFDQVNQDLSVVFQVKKNLRNG